MARVVQSSESCIRYLEKCAANELFVIGLALGQSVQGRDCVFHLARTPEDKNDNTSESSSTSAKTELPRNLNAVSESWISDHATHVTRMLPGGINVQGIFVTSSEDIFDNKENFNKIRNILAYIQKSLVLCEYMHRENPPVSEWLVLHLSTASKTLTCKTVQISKTKAVTVKPVEWKVVSKPLAWQRLECYYDFDEVYPVIVKTSGISVRQQFKQILKAAYKTIEASVTLIDGELKESTEILEQITKKKKTKKSSASPQESLKTMHVSLFVPFENSMPSSVEYLECEGSVHCSGVVAGCVFLSPRATVAEAVAAVKEDLVRSLAARFTMHCDALIDDNLLPEENVCFNEPPRRVLVPVDSLQLCDYLFPGETPQEALVSVRELLDLEITEADVVCDLETPADTSEFDALDRAGGGEEAVPMPREASQLMYLAGLACALFVLALSLLIHYHDVIVAYLRRGVVQKVEDEPIEDLQQ